VPYASVNGINLYYEEHGAGDPLVLIHGFSWSGMVWNGLVPRLADRYRVIVPDLRGHGRSGGAPETMRHHHFATDLVALLDHLGIDRAHFVGHSTGGMSLVFVGTRHLDRVLSLSLVSATYVYDARARAEMLRVVEEMPDRPKVIEAAKRHHGAYHGEDYWKVLREVFRSWTDDPPELPFAPEDLRAITCPVLVLHGDRDPFFPVDVPTTMYRSLPNAELCILPATGHFLPKEEPELFLAVVRGFLERNAPPAS
jgi:pimeloyl-ACP methyl ester carboxylesterase